MNGNKGFLDSNVIASKGIISTQDIIDKYDFLYTSIICYVETLSYNFKDNEEKEIVNQILNSIEIINLNKEIADTAINYRKQKKIKLPDALILATAKYLNADLLSSDISDFQNIIESIQLVEPKKTNKN